MDTKDIKPSEPDDQILNWIRAVEVWYHVMELAPGVVTPGEYDMRPFLPHFNFPDSLEGKTVIDVGASNGFFSFHLEKLGAKRVMAVDLECIEDQDYPKWYVDQHRSTVSQEEVGRLNHQELHAGFETARRILGSRVEKQGFRIYDLAGSLEDRFDLAFCCNVLGHLRDPVAGLEAIHGILEDQGMLILASPVDLTADSSYALFMGDPAKVSWWVPSREALLRMCRMAGFSQASWIGSFEVAPRSEPNNSGTMGVVHCRK